MHHPGDVSHSEDNLRAHQNQREDHSTPTAPLYLGKSLTHTGLIQPHGVFMLVNSESMRILAASENTQTIFNYSSESILQKSLAELLTTEDVAKIQRWSQQFPNTRGTILLEGHPLSLSIYSSETRWQCEFETLHPSGSYPEQLEKVRTTLGQFSAKHTVQSVLDITVDLCCQLTGVERCIAYQFDEQGNGEVIAEVKPQGAIAYKGLHFPASDIPSPVRQMYQNLPLRYIPDLNATPIPLNANQSVVSPDAIDLSHALLRSIDDCCVNYHQSMGVEALVVFPLCIDEKIWGLIALHDSTPTHLSLPERDLLELVGQTTSLALANTLKAEALAYESQLKQLQSELIHALSQSETFEEVLLRPDLQLCDLVKADGVALCLSNGITLMGETPEGEDVLDLLKWAQTQTSNFTYVTHQLPFLFESAKNYADKASGVLLLVLSELQDIAIIWFRTEQQHKITWAGSPNLVDTGMEANGSHISIEEERSPNQSFKQWQELIRHSSSPWLPSEVETARGLRAAISGIALRRADELTRMNQALQQSNEELASFAYAASHDLKEPLRGIYNYTTFLMEDYAELLDEAGIDRMQSLLRLTKRMDRLIDALLKFAQMRQADITIREIDIQKLVESVAEILRISRDDMRFKVLYPRPLPVVVGDPVLLHELFSNLLSNALKYNDSDPKVIEIGYLTPDEQHQQSNLPFLKRKNKTLYFVKDNGIGIKSRHQKTIFRLFKRLHARNRYGGGTGAGLTIVKKIIERHGGEIAVSSEPDKGTTFWFSLS